MDHRVWERAHVVCIHRVDVKGDPSWEDIRRGARELLEAMHPTPGGGVLLKPNLSTPAPPDSGIVTHPSFVEGIVDYFEGIGSDILVAEGGGDGDMSAYWEETGYADLAQRRGVDLVNLNFDERVRIPIEGGEVLKDIQVARTVVEGGKVLVNVATLKTFLLGETSLCTKNLMGVVIPQKERWLCKEWMLKGMAISRAERDERRKEERMMSELREEAEVFFHRVCDLALVIRPSLNLIDGIVAREGTGFFRGRNIPVGLVVAGIHPVCVDTVASRLIGLDPAEVGILRVATERGWGTNRMEEIEVYETVDGELKVCEDVEALVHRPSLRPIRSYPL